MPLRKASELQLYVMGRMERQRLRVLLYDDGRSPYVELVSSDQETEHVFTRTWRSLEARGYIEQEGETYKNGSVAYYVLTDRGRLVLAENPAVLPGKEGKKRPQREVR